MMRSVSSGADSQESHLPFAPDKQVLASIQRFTSWRYIFLVLRILGFYAGQCALKAQFHFEVIDIRQVTLPASK